MRHEGREGREGRVGRVGRVGQLAIVVGLLAGMPAVARAQPAVRTQQPGAGREFDLSALQQAAIDADPRAQQAQLLMAQSELRQRNIAVQRLPSISVDAQTQYQSDVAHLTLPIAGAATPFSPPKDTYDAGIRLDQRLFDATVNAQSGLERAQLAEGQSAVKTRLFALRQQVNDAFFAAASLQSREEALDLTLTALNTRFMETNQRVQQGVALPADAAAIEAVMLQRQQDRDELRANRQAALDRLSTLTGSAIGIDDRLTLPDVSAAAAQARTASDRLRTRPEYEQFTRTRERIEKQQAVAAAQAKPRLSAYARGAYGQPGLNFISRQFETYGLAGVRLQWNAWNWGSTAREREALAIQQQVVAADEAAFARGLTTSIAGDARTIDRLQSALAIDNRIVALREQVERSTLAQFNERVVTASELLDRSTDVLQARIARAGHQVELAQASARLLTTLGLEVR